jgi:cytochrome c oxidase subunit 1
MYNERLGQLASLMIFIGFNATFFPQFVMGSKGLPRRYFTYDPQFTELNVLSSVGSFLLAAGFFLAAGYLIQSLFRGRPAPANPWGSATLEWTAPSPPPTENFETEPDVGDHYDPYDYKHVEYDPQVGGYVEKGQHR